MSTFLEDKAKWGLFLSELGITQLEASEMLGNDKHTLARTITASGKRGAGFPQSLLTLMEFVKLVQEEPKAFEPVLYTILSYPEAFHKETVRAVEFLKKLSEREKIAS